MKREKPTVRTGAPTRARHSARYHHGDLRAALIAAARRILEDEGFDALSLRGVARAAGVSQAAPYHHFADKDALLAAVATEGFEELARTTEARMARVRGPEARLRASGVAYVAFAVANPALFRLMFTSTMRGSLDSEELALAGRRSYEILETAVTDTLSVSPRTSDDARLACLAAWSTVHGLAKLLTETDLRPADYGAKDAETLAAMLITFLGVTDRQSI